MRYAEDIIREINERGPINIPDNCYASDGFDRWMYGNDDCNDNLIWNENNYSYTENDEYEVFNTNYGDAA